MIGCTNFIRLSFWSSLYPCPLKNIRNRTKCYPRPLASGFRHFWFDGTCLCLCISRCLRPFRDCPGSCGTGYAVPPGTRRAASRAALTGHSFALSSAPLPSGLVHLSPFTFHLSPFTFHLSPFTFHLSPFTFQVSGLRFRPSPPYSTGSRTGLSLGSVLSHSSTMEVESPPPIPRIHR